MKEVKTVRLDKKTIQQIDELVDENKKYNTFSEVIEASLEYFFEYKDKINEINKIKYLDEKTSMMLLMLADVVSIQLAYDDEKRIKYISEIHEELASKIRFNQKLY